MKVQFAAISEQKVEVERKLEPLGEGYNKLKKELDDFDTRKERHAVGAPPGFLCYLKPYFSHSPWSTVLSKSA